VEEAAITVSGLGIRADPLPPIKGLCLGAYQRLGGEWGDVAVQRIILTPPAGPRRAVGAWELKGSSM
jgi:hypothetical protein